MPDSLTLKVDGELRYHTVADFSGVNQPLTVFPAIHNTGKFKSITAEILQPQSTIAASPKDEAASLDPEKPIAEDGWTIMFRSDNPLLWNVAVRNKDSYAVPTTAAPKFRYIRLRRMDTEQEVILKSSEFTGRIYPAKSPFFRGDKPVGRGTCALGIVDMKHVDPNVCGVLDNTPQGCLGGWGFGSAEAGPAKQRFLWDSEEIEATAMEIAVTDRTLTPKEQEHLLKK